MKERLANESTVLVVEDDLHLQEWLFDNLKGSFAKVLVASNGVLAIDIMKSHVVDVVLTDFHMPKLNGMELLKYIKQHYPLIPVLFLTANAKDDAVIEAIEKGAVDILEKPIRIELLINRIQNSLLFPEMLQIIWAAMSLESSMPKIEEFTKYPFLKQIEIIHAFGAVIRTKALAKSREVA